MRKFRMRQALPALVLKYRTFNAKTLVEKILIEYNVVRNPKSVTMFFNRNPQIKKDLKSQIIAEELPKLKVNNSIFRNGTFENLRSVKDWLVQLDAREVSRRYIGQKIGLLKKVCQGKWHKQDLVAEGKWCLKHPDRLTLKEVLEYISMMRQRGIDTYQLKRDLKDFMESKGETVGKRISVGKPKSYGKYRKLFVEKATLKEMLDYLRTENYEAYVIACFMYKTGTRIKSTLNALIEDLGIVGERGVITVYDKGRRSKYPRGHPWNKRLDAELLFDMKQLIGDRKHGKIFNFEAQVTCDLTRAALENFAPEILERYPDLKMLNHFWRHMFFQHILRTCDWNYKVAGALGGASSQSVEESYGEPPERTIKKWSERYFIKI